MDHSFYTDRLSAYFDQELKHEEHVIVDQHVQECEECQKILKNLEKFDSFIDENSDLADTGYWEKSAQKIEAAIGGNTKTKVVDIKKESSYKGLWWKLAGVAASIAVIAFISLYETDITDQIDKKKFTPESPQKNEIKTEEQSKPVEGQAESSEDADLTLESIKIPEPKSTQPAPEPSALKEQAGTTQLRSPESVPMNKQRTTRQVRTDELAGRVEVPAESRTEKDAVAASEESEIPINTAPPSYAPQKTKLVEESATADEPVESYEKALEDKVSNLVQKAELSGDSIEQEEKLAVWQNSIITQNNILAKIDNKKTSKKLTNGFAATGTTKDSVDKQAVYTELFEAYYNVALLSKDSLERKNALLQLNNYANDPKFMYQNTAKQYLNQFDSIQTLNLKQIRNNRK